jgi:hypothetical protein
METTATAIDAKELMVQMLLASWHKHIDLFNKFIEPLTAAQIAQVVAPGRNSGLYLLGHLTAVTDYMIVLFGIGERLYPELEQPFIRNADKSGFDFPSFEELKAKWASVHEVLNKGMAGMNADSWLEKHTAVSAEDFAKEPHRNKLNVLISRTTHQEYHFGQMKLMKFN